jgi:hypothetical protein
VGAGAVRLDHRFPRLAGDAPLSADREAAPTSRWPRFALAAALVAFAVAVGIDHVTAVPGVAAAMLLAPGIIIGLTAWAVLRLVRAFAKAPDRAALVTGAAALLVFAALSFVWPKFALVVAALALAARLVRRHRHGHAPRLRGAVSALAGALVLAIATPLVLAGAPHRQPDAFYDPPPGAAGRPGEFIRSEPLTRGVFAGARAWRILYWTTTAEGAPALASGTVVAAANLPAGPRPVVAVAHGTTGVDRACAPSLLDAPFGDGAAAALEAMVAKGWVGVVSDYVGMGTKGPHPYLVGAGAAHDVLDAVRAAHALPGLTLDPRTAVWGHSQGGQTAMWVGMVGTGYAPDVTLIGVATFAPATDLSGLATGVRDTMFGRIISAYLAATWTRIDPSLAPLVRPATAAAADRIGELCFGGRDMIAAAAMTSQMTAPIFTEAAFAGPLADRLGAMAPGGPIAAPLLIAQGTHDDLVLLPRQRAFVAARCAAGQAIDYREYAGRNHLFLVAPDSPLTGDLIAWTEARLRGEPAANTCPR